jgi:hypothetical protein
MATMKDYYARVMEIEAAYGATTWGFRLITDTYVDHQNASDACHSNGFECGSPEYWGYMMASLDNSVGGRLDEMGLLKEFPLELEY